MLGKKGDLLGARSPPLAAPYVATIVRCRPYWLHPQLGCVGFHQGRIPRKGKRFGAGECTPHCWCFRREGLPAFAGARNPHLDGSGKREGQLQAEIGVVTYEGIRRSEDSTATARVSLNRPKDRTSMHN